MSLRNTFFGSLLVLGAVASGEAGAQGLPPPATLVSSLDLECYKTAGPALNQQLTLTHLNPVLIAHGLQPHQVVVRDLAQTCVPVRKNNAVLPPAAAAIVSQVDLACYNIDANPLPMAQPLALTHLNPVLAGLPVHQVTLTRPRQLCVPVAKNNVLPPDNVLAFVRYVDLECYDTDPGAHPAFNVLLDQLNPQLQGIPDHWMSLTDSPRQLCVPVRKNNQAIPQDVLSRLQWLDLERFRATPTVTIAPVNLWLRHLNPLFAGLPQVNVTLDEARGLMVPVAKDGAMPPAD
jgi:hypothetical protein